jgi:hypothetical protein
MKRFLLAKKYSAISIPQSITTDLHSLYSLLLKHLLIIIAILYAFTSNAQSPPNASGVLRTDTREDSAYRKTIRERSAKIVNTLEITDQAKYAIVLDRVMNQYFDLNEVHDGNKKTIGDIKKQGLLKEETDLALVKQEEKKSARLLQLHKAFIGHLKENLSDAQVDKIKDGMTYNVLNVTYTAYLDEIPRLTTTQKEKIYAWLNEARELAMDEGSSEDKHKVFGKYKGRINNYLSAEGYDLKKEEKDWQERLRIRRAAAAEQK